MFQKNKQNEEMNKMVLFKTWPLSRVGWRFCKAKYYPTLTRINQVNGGLAKAHVSFALS